MAAQTVRNYFAQDIEPTNHRSLDRIFVLEATGKLEDGKVDTRLVNGNNKLHAVRDPQMPIWRLKLDQGTLPEAFKSSFTSFTALRKHVEQYYIKRGVKVTEVLD